MTIKHNFWILSILISVVSILFACNNNHSEDYWNAETFTYNLSSAGMEYNLPFSAERWIVASTDSLPDGIKFCAVDSVENVCVMIISLTDKTKHSNITELSHPEIMDIVSEITKQPQTSNSVCDTLSINPANLSGIYAYEFNTDISLTNPNDKSDLIQVCYSGYIFNSQEGIKAIIITSPKNQSDNIPIYLSGLKRTASNKI